VCGLHAIAPPIMAMHNIAIIPNAVMYLFMDSPCVRGMQKNKINK
jgi:ABC-type glycerol-3-phosphate transport system permease component